MNVRSLRFRGRYTAGGESGNRADGADRDGQGLLPQGNTRIREDKILFPDEKPTRGEQASRSGAVLLVEEKLM